MGAQQSSRKVGNKRRPGSKRRRKKLVDERAINAFVESSGRPSPFFPTFYGADSPVLIWKFVIGIAMIPFCWATIETFFATFDHAARSNSFWKTAEFWFFTIGFFGWGVVFAGLVKYRIRWMIWMYVAGHELTHAFFVLLCRGNVAKVHISSEGGHILTNRNNFLISLSPYFLPFYTVLVILGWGLANFFSDAEFSKTAVQILFAVIGVTWAFHLTFTVWMIAREQPDVDQNGRTFSITLIVWINTIIISALLITASPEVAWTDFLGAWWQNFLSLGERFAESVHEITGWFVK